MSYDDTLKRAAELLRRQVQTYPQTSEDEAGGYVSQDDEEMAQTADDLDALREELARQEPVAWRHSNTHSLHDTEDDVYLADGDSVAEPLYIAPQPSQLPDGWQLVPIEPTWEMIAAGCQPGDVIDNADMACAYMAMLAAAPQPGQEPTP